VASALSIVAVMWRSRRNPKSLAPSAPPRLHIAFSWRWSHPAPRQYRAAAQRARATRAVPNTGNGNVVVVGAPPSCFKKTNDYVLVYVRQHRVTSSVNFSPGVRDQGFRGPVVLSTFLAFKFSMMLRISCSHNHSTLYTGEIFERAGTSNCKPAPTPIDNQVHEK
jgi:hypothetical protein